MFNYKREHSAVPLKKEKGGKKKDSNALLLPSSGQAATFS